MDEEAVSSMWKEKFGEEVFRVISSFLPVDRSIIDYVAGAPGITEEFMLSYICDLNNNRSYDRIVWDTAPAGGTLRLLRIEEQFYKHLGEAAKLYLSFKGIIDKIRRGEKNPLEIIDSWRGLASRVLGLLSSDAFSAYVVTIPEWLGVAQTERIIRELEEFNINIEGIIVNQYEKGSGDSLKGKTKIHRKYLRMIEKKYQEAYKLVTIPMQPYEVRGVNQLHKFSRFLEKVDLAEG